MNESLKKRREKKKENHWMWTIGFGNLRTRFWLQRKKMPWSLELKPGGLYPALRQSHYLPVREMFQSTPYKKTIQPRNDFPSERSCIWQFSKLVPQMSFSFQASLKFWSIYTAHIIEGDYLLMDLHWDSRKTNKGTISTHPQGPCPNLYCLGEHNNIKGAILYLWLLISSNFHTVTHDRYS